MIYTENNLQIDEAVEALIEQIKNQSVFQEYQHAKKLMATESVTEEKKKQFYRCKADYEKIAEYGKYAPDWKEKRRAVQQAKRQLDMDEHMALFRQKETQMQMVLDLICQQISHHISPNIKVDAGNPFFTTQKNHCGGGCHVG